MQIREIAPALVQVLLLLVILHFYLSSKYDPESLTRLLNSQSKLKWLYLTAVLLGSFVVLLFGFLQLLSWAHFSLISRDLPAREVLSLVLAAFGAFHLASLAESRAREATELRKQDV